MYQSTSSILLDALSVGACESFSRGGSSSSILSSSMERPSLIILWMRVANADGSSRENPEAKRAVSKSSQIKSFTVLSLLSCSDLVFNSMMIGWSGLIYIVFFDTI